MFVSPAIEHCGLGGEGGREEQKKYIVGWKRRKLVYELYLMCITCTIGDHAQIDLLVTVRYYMYHKLKLQ